MCGAMNVKFIVLISYINDINPKRKCALSATALPLGSIHYVHTNAG